MTRWTMVLIVALLPLATLGWLWWRLRASPASEPSDEILAYQLSQDLRSVTLRVPGGIDEILITTWAIEPPGARLLLERRDATQRFPYSFDLVALDPKGERRFEQHVDADSRVSTADGAASDGDYTVRLADSDAPVTDGRTQSIPLAGALPQGGTLRLETTLAPGAVLLMRAAYREPRGALEEDSYELGLSDHDRRRLVEGRTALGFEDLMPATRKRALSMWGRRLDAVGREGVDYSVRRLLFGDLRTTAAPVAGAQGGFDVGPRHFAAFNFVGPVHLEVRAAPATDLRAGSGVLAPVPLHVPESGTASLDDPVEGAHTLVIEGVNAPDVHAHLLVRGAAEPRVQIGDRLAVLRGPEVSEIEPDVRRFRFFRLDLDKPVVTHPAREQTRLRIVVRAAVSADADPVSGSLVARWNQNSTSREATIQVLLPTSKFERWRGAGDATDARSATLSFPAGTSAIEIVGSPWLAVSLFAEDPDTPADLLALPYHVPLPEDRTWRNAPYDLRHWVSIRPANADDLEAAGRGWDLTAQVRIEPVGPRGGGGGAGPEPPERLLLPVGDVLARHFMESAVEPSGPTFPLDAWTGVGVGPSHSTSVDVETSGPRARRLTVMYLAGEGQLGGAAKVTVDGQLLATRPLMVTSGTVELPVAPGKHDVSVDGLGEGGAAFVDARPPAGAKILRRRVLFEITPEHDLRFRFSQPPGRTLTVVILAATDSGEMPMFRYSVDGGDPKLQVGSFFHVSTLPSGMLDVANTDLRGFFWEAFESAGAVGAKPAASTEPSLVVRKAKLRLGDDLAGPTREVRLHCVLPTGRAWVRAVLVGEAPGQPEDTRVWAGQAEQAEQAGQAGPGE